LAKKTHPLFFIQILRPPRLNGNQYCAKHSPAPKATAVSGFSAKRTVTFCFLMQQVNSPSNKAPPPAKTILYP
jgi:hypothetical protein